MHVSIGIAVGAPGQDSPDEMLRKADVALYEAKRRGKSQYRIFHPSMRDALRKRRTLAFELERAVSDEELSVVYQPVVSLHDCRPVALEALVRWNHPERGLVPPGEFIAFAEETGAVVEIGAIVLERVVEMAAQLRIPIHANVCAPELVDPGFLDRLDALIDIHSLPPELLVFELTERAFVGDDPVPLAVLEALHKRGMGVAVDDFGTGYSSLAYLSRLPVDTMKIPKQFIDEVTGSREHHALARAVIELGAALDLKVDRRGHRDARADRRAARLRLRPWPGLLLRDARRRAPRAPPCRDAAPGDSPGAARRLGAALASSDARRSWPGPARRPRTSSRARSSCRRSRGRSAGWS